MNTDRKPSVLLVDDIPANLVALEALLEDMNCELIRASSGNEALRQLLRREFAVMLLDVQMPGMDGYEVARYARDNSATRDVPIIFLTANSHDEAGVLRGYGSGAVDFLRKPLDAKILRAKVTVFVELYRSRRLLADEVTAHTQTLRALEQANTALRHFTNAASHDLRAPLRSIRGFLEALAEHTEGQLDGQATDYLERSRRAAHRMDSLLSSLLVYAGLQRPLAAAEVDCTTLIQQVQADLSEPIARCQASVTATELPKVYGDVDRLYQLLLNLVGNALKFRNATEPVHVHISAEAGADENVFCVADNGIGIAAADQAAIFDPFQRVYAQKQYEGSGLGLTICRQIIEQHAGRLWVESERGHGSRFYFALPKRPPTANNGH